MVKLFRIFGLMSLAFNDLLLVPSKVFEIVLLLSLNTAFNRGRGKALPLWS